MSKGANAAKVNAQLRAELEAVQAAIRRLERRAVAAEAAKAAAEAEVERMARETAPLMRAQQLATDDYQRIQAECMATATKEAQDRMAEFVELLIGGLKRAGITVDPKLTLEEFEQLDRLAGQPVEFGDEAAMGDRYVRRARRSPQRYRKLVDHGGQLMGEHSDRPLDKVARIGDRPVGNST